MQSSNASLSVFLSTTTLLTERGIVLLSADLRHHYQSKHCSAKTAILQIGTYRHSNVDTHHSSFSMCMCKWISVCLSLPTCLALSLSVCLPVSLSVYLNVYVLWFVSASQHAWSCWNTWAGDTRKVSMVYSKVTAGCSAILVFSFTALISCI